MLHLCYARLDLKGQHLGQPAGGVGERLAVLTANQYFAVGGYQLNEFVVPGIELRSQCQFEQHAVGLLLAQR